MPGMPPLGMPPPGMPGGALGMPPGMPGGLEFPGLPCPGAGWARPEYDPSAQQQPIMMMAPPPQQERRWWGEDTDRNRDGGDRNRDGGDRDKRYRKDRRDEAGREERDRYWEDRRGIQEAKKKDKEKVSVFGEPAKEEDGGEVEMRCHLHRKPQQSCRTCRRVYASVLNQGTLENDRRRPERARPGYDDDTYNSHEAFEVTNKQTYNFNSMLRDQILKSTYFKSLMSIETFEGIVDELYQYAESAEVYGAGTTTVPSTLFCCLFRIFTIGISYEELMQLCDNQDSPFIRCCGFLYIRFGCDPSRLWEQLGDFCLDDQEFEPAKAQNFHITIGEYVEALLMDERYYYTALPRIPVGVKKKIEERIAPLGQYRRRTFANKKVLEMLREPGTPVEVCREGVWSDAVSVMVDDRLPSRLRVRVRLEDDSGSTDGPTILVHIGEVVLREHGRGGRGRSRSRSRSRERGRGQSPDWSRTKGKTDDECVQELRARQRERAVCSTGKDYARKPIGFMSGLALKRDVGVASSRLREEETYAPRQVERRKQMGEELNFERATEDGRGSRLQQQIYEKYSGQQKQKDGDQEWGGQDWDDQERPEVLRLG